MNYLFLFLLPVLVWLIGHIATSDLYSQYLKTQTDYNLKDKSNFKLEDVRLTTLQSYNLVATIASFVIIMAICLTVYLTEASNSQKIKSYEAFKSEIKKEQRKEVQQEIYEELQKELNKPK